MNRFAIKTLKGIRELGKNQPLKGVSIKHLSQNILMEHQDLIEILEWLQEEDYVRLKKIKGENTKVVLTEKGYSRANPWHSEAKWRFVFAILGAIATFSGFILLLPNLMGFIRSTNSEIVIEDMFLGYSFSNLYPVTDNEILKSPIQSWEEVEGVKADCLHRNASDCDLVVYSSLFSDIPSLKINVSSIASDQSILIQGIRVGFVDFKEMNDTLDVLYIVPYVGGGGGWSYFSLGDFPSLTEIWPNIFELNKFEPTKALGTSVLVKPTCSDADECDQFKFLSPGEIDGFALNMPFLEKLSPGWYEFEISIQFTKEGKEYISNSRKRFDVVVPKRVRPWIYDSVRSTDFFYPSIFEVDFITGEIFSSKNLPATTDIEANLIFKSRMALDKGYYIWNIKSGEIKKAGDFGSFFIPRTTHSNTSNGWISAKEIVNIPNIDIGIVDLHKGNFVNITPTDSIREIHPSLSPSGKLVSYVAFATQDTDELEVGQADIFVMDLESRSSFRVTNTPNVIETSPVWVDDQSIAFIMPEAISTDGTILPNFYNSQVGLGIVDIETGEITILNSVPFNQTTSLQYLPNTQIFATTELKYLPFAGEYQVFSRNGEEIDHIPSHSGLMCYLMDSIPFQQFCWDEENIGIFR